MVRTAESRGQVPLIDFGPLADGSLAGVARVAADVREACEQIGFFYIANHPIPAPLIRRVFDETAAFFALPASEKLHVSIERSSNYRGYIPFDAKLYPENRRGHGVDGFQRHLDGHDLYDQPPDCAESFQIHAELADDDPDVRAQKPLHGANQWPQARPSLRGALLEYYAAVRSLAYQVLETFAVGLELERDFFEQYYRKPLMQLRLMHYPPQDEGGKVAYGVRPHSDAGAFSMLLQDDTGGLEIRNRQGEWAFVAPIENAFVVNIGDTMRLWTNNRFQSTPHRVINTYGAERISIPFFANPDYDAVIKPIPTCVGPDRPAVFDELHCGEAMLHTYSRIWPSAPTHTQ